MKKIRQKCFESNSSSSHVFVVNKNNKHVTEEDITDRNSPEYIYLWYKSGGLWEVDGTSGGFGRGPFKILFTFKDKFRYVLSEYMGSYMFPPSNVEEMEEELKNIVVETFPNVIKDIEISNRREVSIFLDKNGNEIPYSELKYDRWDSESNKSIYKYMASDGKLYEAKEDEEEYYDCPDIGPIDHQSMGTLRGFLKEKNITLKEFLTNKKYRIVIDGDETEKYLEYLKSGDIDANIIEDVYGASKYYEEEIKEYIKSKGNGNDC